MDVDFTLKPAVMFTLAVGVPLLLTVNAEDTISLSPSMNVAVSASSSRRLSATALDALDAEFVAGSPVAPGHSILAKFEVDEEIENVVFRMSSSCWGDTWLWLQEATISPALPSVSIPLPFHVLLTGTACEEYYIEAFEPHHEMDAIRSKPFAIPGLLQQDGSFCQPSIVTRPSDGESVSVLAPYEFRWKADELFWYNSTSMVFDGSIIYADRVKIELLGILTNYDEEKGCEFGYTEKDNCTELTILTPEEGAPNTGSFVFDFSSNVTGHGDPLSWDGPWNTSRYAGGLQIRISAHAHSYTASRSTGLFYLGKVKESPSCPAIGIDPMPVLSSPVPFIKKNDVKQRQLGTGGSGFLTASYNLKAANDFGHVSLDFFYNLFTVVIFANTRNPDMEITLISDLIFLNRWKFTYGKYQKAGGGGGDDDDDERKNHGTIYAVIGAAVAGGIVLIVIFVRCYCKRKKNAVKADTDVEEANSAETSAIPELEMAPATVLVATVVEVTSDQEAVPETGRKSETKERKSRHKKTKKNDNSSSKVSQVQPTMNT